MPKLDRVAVLFSINCFAAMALALAIGFGLDLPRPYWAVMTVYITSQPLAGGVRSKAVFRLIGTFSGALFTVFALPPLVNEPWLLITALGLWVGGCLGVSLLDRTPRAYALMLAGYTATLIGFPTVDHPGQIFDVAVSRVEEISLGIVCATITHSLFFPSPVGAMLKLRVAAWLKDADAWTLALLRQNEGEAVADRRHLATAANEIHMLSILLPFDTSALRYAVETVRAIHHRFLTLIPVLSGIDDRLQALRAEAGGIDGPPREAMAAIADWIETGADYEVSRSLHQRIEEWKSADRGADWKALLRFSLFSRLQDLLIDLGEGHLLHKTLLAPPGPLPVELPVILSKSTRKRLHRDIGLAALSGLGAFLTIAIVCGLWVQSGWPDGTAAAALAGVYCALFAALDDPAPAIERFGWMIALAMPLAAFFLFTVLPGIDGLPLLLLFIAPPFLVAGALMVDRKTASWALPFTIAFASALALQETYTADFAAFMNSNLAIYVSLFVAIMVTRSIRSISVDTAAHRLLIRTWRQLATLARDPGTANSTELAAEMVDRLGLLVPKLAAAQPSSINGQDVLTDLRIGMNIALVQHYRASLPAEQGARLTDLLQRVGAHFSSLTEKREPPPPSATLPVLDSCMRAALAAAGEHHQAGIAALVGLRRNLFPKAPAFAETV